MSEIIVLLAGILIASFIVVSYVALFIYPLKSGAPYVPSNPEVVTSMIGMANLGPGKVAADLGSGDGRIVVAIANTGAEAHGYEISPPLVALSRSKLKKLNLNNAFIHKKDFWKEDLSGYDAIFMYQLPYVMQKIEPKFLDSLKPGAVVISNAFSIKKWKPFRSENSIFAYNVGENTGNKDSSQH
ncbi:class I SAM-dependent methyltransferase [candidate division WWE3 bacterium]|jgi:protein-L-isoaspartate O-methyltransferase|uniref:Class I SAM-dependent methyltransferase n=1 Tax=candidate division WWE3 bacterium TaxID=2053526 RepID=A0A3A4ZC27_UNCKA|nr:MAG: class I SAM-dependent methyltransferase [candidate division WWE3 bacterium]